MSSAGSWAQLPLEVRRMIIREMILSTSPMDLHVRDHWHIRTVSVVNNLRSLAHTSFDFGYQDCLPALRSMLRALDNPGQKIGLRLIELYAENESDLAGEW